MLMKWLRNRIDEMVRQSLYKQQMIVDWAAPPLGLPREPKRIFIPEEHIEEILRLYDENSKTADVLIHYRFWKRIYEVTGADQRVAWSFVLSPAFPYIQENFDKVVVVPPDYEHKEKPQTIEMKINVDSTEAEARIAYMSEQLRRFNESAEVAESLFRLAERLKSFMPSAKAAKKTL